MPFERRRRRGKRVLEKGQFRKVRSRKAAALQAGKLIKIAQTAEVREVMTDRVVGDFIRDELKPVIDGFREGKLKRDNIKRFNFKAVQFVMVARDALLKRAEKIMPKVTRNPSIVRDRLVILKSVYATDKVLNRKLRRWIYFANEFAKTPEEERTLWQAAKVLEIVKWIQEIESERASSRKQKKK